MKKFYKRYKDLVVVSLLLLLCLKSCQSCSRNRRIEFNNRKYEMIVDSLQQTILFIDSQKDSLRNDIQLYTNQISSLESTINIYKEANQSLINDNKHYRNTNRVLINTNNQIINKDK